MRAKKLETKVPKGHTHRVVVFLGSLTTLSSRLEVYYMYRERQTGLGLHLHPRAAMLARVDFASASWFCSPSRNCRHGNMRLQQARPTTEGAKR